ncbi:integrase [Burkholderia multivorans]|uniref:site-specific integrase n=1 Tax=Burkholderia multivorans TaxID=87883 RepID=UPI00075AA4C3|nr:site-specific integrase [Burkholderia multivorans]KVQ85510.1 integrase [Burkholderia multivorans]
MERKQRLPAGIEVRNGARGASLRLRFYYRGQECRETLKLEPTPKNIQYADRLRGEILRKIELGTFNYAEYFPDSRRAAAPRAASPTEVTVGERLDDFMAQAEKAVAKTRMSPSTLNGYRKVVDGRLRPRWGNVRLVDVRPADLRKWISDLDVTLKTARNILGPLGAVLADALNDELITENPLTKIDLKKLLSKTTRPSDYEVDPFSIDEIRAILTAADELYPGGAARNLFQFAFWSGMRTSELIALDWLHVDLDAGVVRVRNAQVVGTMKTTKTKAGLRDVLLLPSARAALEAQREVTRGMEHNRVFTVPWHGGPWSGDKQIRVNCWAYVLRKAQVRYRNPYQTRHTFASMLLSRGENPLWVAQQMGHVDTEMITKTYGKWIPDSSAAGGYKPLNAWDDFANVVPKSGSAA